MSEAVCYSCGNNVESFIVCRVGNRVKIRVGVVSGVMDFDDDDDVPDLVYRYFVKRVVCRNLRKGLCLVDGVLCGLVGRSIRRE